MEQLEGQHFFFREHSINIWKWWEGVGGSKKAFFSVIWKLQNMLHSFKTKYVCLPTPGAPLESSGSFGLWLLSLSISLLACSWSSVSISSFSSSVFSAFSSSSASDFWDLLLSDSSASDFWDLLLSDVISPSLVSSEASSLIPAEANLAWKKMFYVSKVDQTLASLFKCDELASRTSIYGSKFLVLASSLRQNLDKNQNLDKQINSFHIQKPYACHHKPLLNTSHT